jgi:hypothetical protein
MRSSVIRLHRYGVAPPGTDLVHGERVSRREVLRRLVKISQGVMHPFPEVRFAART